MTWLMLFGYNGHSMKTAVFVVLTGVCVLMEGCSSETRIYEVCGYGNDDLSRACRMEYLMRCQGGKMPSSDCPKK